MIELNWRIGVEIELIAPQGRSRSDLAEEIAWAFGGTVRRFFHPQSEPSKVQDSPIFQNLTLGFEVLDPEGCLIAQCVDDLTLQEDLDPNHPPQPGWYRIVSDDSRLLKLVERQADPAASLAEVLTPIAQLFGTQTEFGPGGMVRVDDDSGASIAIAAPLPGERERPCELITPPIDTDHQERLESLLKVARSLGFTAPIEGATHLHFDASPLCSSHALANLINLLWTHGANLRKLVGTNPRCRRLGAWHKSLYEVVQSPDFQMLPWEEATQHLKSVELTKYCDFNIMNFIHATEHKHTFEARIFPVWLNAQPILEATGLIEAILKRAVKPEKVPSLPPQSWSKATVKTFLNELPMSEELRQVWQTRLAALAETAT